MRPYHARVTDRSAKAPRRAKLNGTGVAAREMDLVEECISPAEFRPSGHQCSSGL